MSAGLDAGRGVRHRHAPQRHVVRRGRAALPRRLARRSRAACCAPGPTIRRGTSRSRRSCSSTTSCSRISAVPGTSRRSSIRAGSTTPGSTPFRERAAEILDETFGPRARVGRAVIAWKDPRLSLLLPFWRTVTPIATTIVVVRDPVEVAASLGAARLPGRARRRPRASGCATSSRRRPTIPGICSCATPTSSTTCRARSRASRATSACPRPTPRSEAAVREHLDGGLRHHDADDRVAAGSRQPAARPRARDLERRRGRPRSPLPARSSPISSAGVGCGRRSTASCWPAPAPTSCARGRRCARRIAGSRCSKRSSPTGNARPRRESPRA